MSSSAYFVIVTSDENEITKSELILHESNTFEYILNTYFSEYANNVDKIISRNTQEEFNLSDIIIPLIHQSDFILFILKKPD
jgi:hypothetical protein